MMDLGHLWQWMVNVSLMETGNLTQLELFVQQKHLHDTVNSMSTVTANKHHCFLGHLITVTVDINEKANKTASYSNIV